MEVIIPVSGAVMAAAAAFWRTQVQVRNARKADYDKEVRLAVAQAAHTVGGAAHSLEWLLWKARFTPNDFSIDFVAAYNEEMHGYLPTIIGDLAVISALSRPHFDAMKDLADEVMNYGGEVAGIAAGLRDGDRETVDRLAERYETARIIRERLNDAVANILT